MTLHYTYENNRIHLIALTTILCTTRHCLFFPVHGLVAPPTTTTPSRPCRLQHCRHNPTLALKLTTQSFDYNDRLFPFQVYETIQESKIAVIPNFAPAHEIATLCRDAQHLHAQNLFATDALASYGTSGTFDPSKDRAVLRLNRWKDSSLGDWETRRQFGDRMGALRADLAHHLHRPYLNTGVSTTSRYGNGSTEISYTRFGPGAFLKRHVDEHHEELKGRDGWAKPTRRSISWLVYLNEDWNGQRDGGQLRCYERTSMTSGTVGAQANGDLQIGWLRASTLDPVERPVFLDARRYHGSSNSNHNCAMYIQDPNAPSRVQYITKDFTAHPILYMAGSELMAKRLLMERQDLASRFYFIEPPKSKLNDLLSFMSSSDTHRPSSSPKFMARDNDDELIADVDPVGGTLVLFDSVSLPHEVMATVGRERWATSGWFHEDQQQVEGDER